jgi:hypothetical protein
MAEKFTVELRLSGCYLMDSFDFLQQKMPKVYFWNFFYVKLLQELFLLLVVSSTSSLVCDIKRAETSLNSRSRCPLILLLSDVTRLKLLYTNCSSGFNPHEEVRHRSS